MTSYSTFLRESCGFNPLRQRKERKKRSLTYPDWLLSSLSSWIKGSTPVLAVCESHPLFSLWLPWSAWNETFCFELNRMFCIKESAFFFSFFALVANLTGNMSWSQREHDCFLFPVEVQNRREWLLHSPGVIALCFSCRKFAAGYLARVCPNCTLKLGIDVYISKLEQHMGIRCHRRPMQGWTLP